MTDDLTNDLLERIPWVGGHADVWRTFSDERFFPRLVAALADPYRAEGVTKVAGIEARGFILGVDGNLLYATERWGQDSLQRKRIAIHLQPA